ncbi:hypothetical protein RJ640_006676 [Escallonia rubra]|uniref:Bifunctional inhibitor/plant lipid transfer protein/seed storage helical domain-containing protein n=1 Tax=Escallonia rubra TaxID=112253 RepID=A0AA88UKF6_9ASTE|nr:hypothetical protein RJ640_006676 [Escallonia rubra]
MVAAWAQQAVNGAHHHPPTSQPPVSLAPAPAVDCNTLIYQMVDCMTFLTSGSKETKPDAACCSGLKTVVDTDADCICEALKSSAQLGIDVNMTNAMTLPSACKVSSPPLSSCNANPPPAPKVSPTPSSPSSAPPAPGGGGGAAPEAPAPSPVSSGAWAISASCALLLSMAIAPFVYLVA